MKIVEKIAAVLLATVLTTIVASAQALKHVNAIGLSFAYVEEGSGPPLVLIHGSVFDYREWSKQPLSGTLLKPVLAMRKGADRELTRVRQKSEGILIGEIKKTYKGKVVVGHDLDIF